jgi:hypothetical protein
LLLNNEEKLTLEDINFAHCDVKKK